MSETYGFVYIWRDKVRNRFYIGSHWGTENDGYVCSSTWMRNTYRRHKDDFRRRILSKVYTNRKDLLEVEHRWLSLIPDEELGKRYYNVSKHHFGHWSSDETKRQKIISEQKGKTYEERYGSEKALEMKEKQRQAKLGKTNPHKGKTLEELHGPEKAAEIKSKLIHSHLGQEAWNKGKEYLQIQGDNHWTKKKGGHTEESKEKIRQAKLGKEIPKNCGENHWTAKVQRPPHKTAAERQRDYRSRQKAKMESLNM